MKYTKDVGAEIIQQYQLSKQFLDPIHEKMNGQEEMYRSYINSQSYPHGARVFDPRIFRVIETIVPRLVASEPIGTFYPKGAGEEATAMILKAMLRYDWQKTGMFKKLVEYYKGVMIFGTGFGRIYWDYDEVEKQRMVPTEVDGRMIWSPKSTEKIKVTRSDNPNFEPLNIYDCFPDPNATSLETMRWFIYRRFKTLEELEKENQTRGVEYYKNLKVLREQYNAKQQKGEGVSMDNYYREHRRTMLQTQEFIGKDGSNQDIVVLTRFTKDRWCDIVPEFGNLVIREIENPYFHGELPITYAVDYPYPNELYGMGEIEPIERLQRAINAVLNLRLDNVQLTLNTMWKVRKGADVDMDSLLSRPGNIIQTADMDAVNPIQIPDVTGSTFVNTMTYLTSALQNGSGITDFTVGLNNSSNTVNQTATGVRLIQQEANAQFKLKIQLLNKMVVEKIANQWKDLRIQFTTSEEKFRIIGKDFIEYLRDNSQLSKTGLDGQPVIPGDETQAKLEIKNDFAFLSVLPEDIQPYLAGEYDFVVRSSSEQIDDPVILQENFFMALDRILNPAWQEGLMAQGKSLNYEDITKKIFDKLNLGMDFQGVLVDAQPPVQPEMPQVGPDGQPINPIDAILGDNSNILEQSISSQQNGLPTTGTEPGSSVPGANANGGMEIPQELLPRAS